MQGGRATRRGAGQRKSVAAQLGNRIEHGLRAFSPAEQKVVRAVAETFRANPGFDTATAILELGTGEALVSFLQGDGSPSVVERAFILPPQSLMGGIDEAARKDALAHDPVAGKYDAMVDRESAYELLQAKYQREDDEKREDVQRAQKAKEDEETRKRQEKLDEEERKRQARIEELQERERLKAEKNTRTTFYGATVQGKGKTAIERMADNAMSSAGRQLASTLVRSVLGSLLKR